MVIRPTTLLIWHSFHEITKEFELASTMLEDLDAKSLRNRYLKILLNLLHRIWLLQIKLGSSKLITMQIKHDVYGYNWIFMHI